MPDQDNVEFYAAEMRKVAPWPCDRAERLSHLNAFTIGAIGSAASYEVPRIGEIRAILAALDIVKAENNL